ncbi:MAG: response regulator [Chlamydiae bacterium]|nr:response regulator [Chlamydiota bacterium]MBI3266793.1 response regulator [Chlamydiota bacterium]
MKIDKSRFIATFITEAQDYLTLLNQGLVRLEKEGSNLELLAELFRVAHTLKGASQMMGFMKIRTVAHQLEDVFDFLKEGKLKLEGGIADLVFNSLDRIKMGLEHIAKTQEEEIQTDDLSSRFSEVCGPIEKESTPSNISKRGDTEKPKEFSPPLTPLKEILPSEKRGPRREAVSPGASVASTDEYIRVPVSRINDLLNLMGEMVISKVKSSYKMTLFKRLSKQALISERMLYELETLIKDQLEIQDILFENKGSVLRGSQGKASRLLDQLHQVETVFGDFRREFSTLSDDIQNEIFHLNPVIEELQQKMKEIRMLPCATLFEGFPRLVRDIAKQEGKEVNFLVQGEETELDKKVLEAIKGPLIHVLRNAMDHGIEGAQERLALGKPKEGNIVLGAYQEGSKVVIQVQDDGRGIDLEGVKATALKKNLVDAQKLQEMKEEEILSLIFMDGFSTAPIVTDVSGRGVGLSVVRLELEKLKGSVRVLSEKGKGTTVRLELPLTIAILQVLLVSAGGVQWAFPMPNLEESLKVAWSRVATIENRMVIQVRSQSVPVIPLVDVLGVRQGSADERQEEMTVVVVNSLGKRIGFAVDHVLGEREVFIKNLGAHLSKVKGVSGATILASGEVIVILDVQDLVIQAQSASPRAPLGHERFVKVQKKVLVVEDSLTTRELEKTILENNGFEVETAIDGLDALEKLGKLSYDVVVSDIQMPRMDGFELCKNIRLSEKWKELPVIFVTALSKEEEKRKGIEVGAQAYIIKSQFDQKNLLEMVNRFV